MCVLSKQLSRTPDTYKHLLNIWQGMYMHMRIQYTQKSSQCTICLILGIKESHGGDPPLWCYVRFTEPVARFCSIEDFRYLVSTSCPSPS
jgi:hypothetical protein